MINESNEERIKRLVKQRMGSNEYNKVLRELSDSYRNAITGPYKQKSDYGWVLGVAAVVLVVLVVYEIIARI